MSDAIEPGRPRARISRRQALGGIGGGLVATVLVPEAAEAKPLPWPRGKGDATASPLSRSGCTVTPLPGGLLLVAGGYQSSATGAVQIYDPHRGEWFDAAPMNTPRFYHAAVALFDGRVLVAGGKFLDVLSSAEIYDPRGNEWSHVAPMNGPRAEHGAAPITGTQVLVTGGFYRAPLSSVEIYDPTADRWTRL